MRLIESAGRVFLPGLLFLLLLAPVKVVAEAGDVLDGSLASQVAPQVSISYPTDGSVVPVRKGKRSSILVRGAAEAIPAGWKLYVVVHPTQNDNVWASEIAPGGKEWVGQAFLGGPGGLPGDGDMFEILATIRAADNPLPSTFVVQDQPLLYPSQVIRVKVKLESWSERAVALLKDLQVSGPIAAFFTALGAVIAAMLGRGSTLNRRRHSGTNRQVQMGRD